MDRRVGPNVVRIKNRAATDLSSSVSSLKSKTSIWYTIEEGLPLTRLAGTSILQPGSDRLLSAAAAAAAVR